MIPKETIDKIIDESRIDEVISDFVALKKRGVNLLGHCPFHNEKTPSFTVSPAKGIYKCFGCGVSGNAVNFVMEHEQMSYPEALKYLAKKYNITVEEKEISEDEKLKMDKRESLFLVSKFAKEQFIKNLNETDEGKSVGLGYFKRRGVSSEMIEKFGLGYSFEERNHFTKIAIEKGYKKENLIDSGLTSERNNQLYDRFFGRVIFPIHNLSGRTIGFGARILQANKKSAKYLNSPETDIYHKSDVLYGLYLAKRSIIQHDNCFLVEGYTDVISLHQKEIENVVASSGTSLTKGQIKLIKRFTPNITVLYDGDEAGIKASFRGIDLILKEGMNVKVVTFPNGEDPDSFARSHTRSELEEYINEHKQDFINFKTSILLKDAQNDPIKRAELIKEVVHTIAIIPDMIVRSVYTQEASKLLNIGEQNLVNELNKIRRINFEKDRSKIETDDPFITTTGENDGDTGSGDGGDGGGGDESDGDNQGDGRGSRGGDESLEVYLKDKDFTKKSFLISKSDESNYYKIIINSKKKLAKNISKNIILKQKGDSITGAEFKILEIKSSDNIEYKNIESTTNGLIVKNVIIPNKLLVKIKEDYKSKLIVEID